jgi:hypothetical protein
MHTRFVRLHGWNVVKGAIVGLALAASSTANAAAIIHTSDPSVIQAFQNGAIVEGFDAGLSGKVITAYDSEDVLNNNRFHSRDITNPDLPAFNSGGATFPDPASNPGLGIGIFDPDGPIANDVKSLNNVAGPLDIGNDEKSFGGFMEVIFVNPVSKVGFEITFGENVRLILKDVNNQNLSTNPFQANGSAGNFLGIERDSADIGGITILDLGGKSFTIDNFTYGRGSGTSVPDTGSNLFSLALAGGCLWMGRRAFKPSR